MKRYLVIYNPSSGKELAAQRIFQASRIVLEKEETEFTFFATKKKGDAETTAFRGCNDGYDLIISCGGDGTAREVVNGIMKSGSKSKLAIMPAGTVNDFAEQLNIPKSPIDFANLIIKGNYKSIDVGKINEAYFLNVAGGGAFTNIPHNVTIEAKTLLGKYAYYFQAAIDVPGQLEKTYNIKYTIDGEELNVNTLLFLIVNTSGAGGFKSLCPKAKIDDGLLDLVVFEKTNNSDLLQILTKVFNGQHINHQKVHYLQGKNIIINSDKKLTIDTDGDLGGYAPAEITSIQKAIDILVP
ncbi:diacylglycerol/lipid kinase family protein [Sedimentibacter sp. MB31-C6]|uniref:diacylglycerol/lipid kinase family protein n=1 Tax=Sedimentibacter sp. MB31-C6 TaxID=3109366 RepID=UPI002DDD4212|nr:YegS/Rv2252/BmrU family lipid kinase [Sedimentibacter sp. MB36-C1]WSI02958.1 YegS/Rv2252/BmrU family lipid kinase [Sedimentibacter sp. MB36-C1]